MKESLDYQKLVPAEIIPAASAEPQQISNVALAQVPRNESNMLTVSEILAACGEENDGVSETSKVILSAFH